MDKYLLLPLLVPISAGFSPLVAKTNETRPNVVVFIADDCTYRDLGCYGSTNSITPNIDRLASEGIRFTNFFQAAPMSSPTRHCLMTGLYPVKSGAYPNHTRVNDGVTSVVQYMRNEGYRVALQGKRHIAPVSVFDYEYLSGANADVDTSKIRPFLVDVKEGEAPFCLFVCSHQPHTPWNKGDKGKFNADSLNLPSYYVDTPETREALTRYYAEINYMDDQVGQVLALLSETGFEENTVFFFTSEQGNSLPFAKWTCYDMGLQTGMIVRWPGVINGGTVSDAIAEYVDVTPTLIELAGGSPEQYSLDGSSFAGLLTGEKTEFKKYSYGLQTSRGINFGPEYFGVRSVRTAEYAYIRNLTPEAEFKCAMTVDKDLVWVSWKERSESDEGAKDLVYKYTHRPAEELYDRVNDPDQRYNLAEDPRYADVLKELSGKLDEWMESQGDKGQETEMEALEHQTRGK